MPRINERTGGFRTERTKLRRQPDRGAHDFETIARILDEALYCHIGFVSDSQPYVVPTIYGRSGRSLYIHGATVSRMVTELSRGLPICLTVTLIDGLVLARSAFHHSMNYRSVMVLGVAHEVGPGEKLRGLEAISEHAVRGRWADVRPPNAKELAGTTVLKLEIEEASAKIRQGPPVDAEADFALPVWAGELRYALAPQPPVPDDRVPPEVELPAYLAAYRRPQERPCS